jgi:MFS family permease
MDDRMKGQAAGIFFIGYVLLQMPGGHFALRWSARKIVSLCLVAWGLCAIACGFSGSFHQFEAARFFLGVAESAVFPATFVLLANWFPRAERARANNGWLLCQPLALACTAPITSCLLGAYGWRSMLVIEGLMPFLFLPVWWFCIRDHPRETKWISASEKDFLETTLEREAEERNRAAAGSWIASLMKPSMPVMVVICFLHNCAAYGCMTFFTNRLKDQGFSAGQYGFLFAAPYAVTAAMMVLNSWHSDRTRERRGHVSAAYFMGGAALILSVVLSSHFWLSYALLCLAIPGPFAAMAPFWSNLGETLPGNALGVAAGLINAFGNLGGFVGPFIVGWLLKEYQSTALAFNVLGASLLVCAALSFLLPKPSIAIAAK